jgi:hypothetical protein
MAVKGMGMLGVSVREMKALTVKMEMVKVGRIWHALCTKCRKLIVKYFFSAHVCFLGLSWPGINKFSLD